MKITRIPSFLAAMLACVLAFVAASALAADPLPSWNDTAAKQAIVAFVEKVTTAGSPDFAPVPERIATPSTRHLTLETSQVAAVRRERARHA
jgi:hypothetical protein